MSEFVGPITRVDTEKSHHYLDANKQRVPGVTTILGDGLPKKALINWAGKATAGWAIDHWDELAKMPLSKRLQKLEGARYEEKDAASNRGTEVHNIAEKLIHGETVPVPDAIAGHVESCVRFLDEFEPEFRLVEVVVFSEKYGWCGTLDGVAWFPTLEKLLLVDWKTNRTGIFGETALQFAGYRYADFYYDKDGTQHDMVEVDGCAAIHIRADGYSLRPVTVGQQELNDLRYAKKIKEFDARSRDLVGAEITPPTRSRLRRLEIIEEESVAS